MLSGRYVTDYRSRHWDKTNPGGCCRLCGSNHSSLEHILIECPRLSETRASLANMWAAATFNPNMREIIEAASSLNSTELTSFLLDPLKFYFVIVKTQNKKIQPDDILHLCRTWCYDIHRKREKLLKETF